MACRRCRQTDHNSRTCGKNIKAEHNGTSLQVRSGERFPPLSREEEVICATKWQKERDKKSLDRLVLSNYGLVFNIVKKTYGKGTAFEDVLQEGFVGVMYAADRFDPTKGFRFGTYANAWVKAMVFEFIARMGGIIRVGTTRTQRKALFGMRKAIRALENSGKDVTTSSISEFLGVPEADVELISNRTRPGNDQSLEDPVGTNGGTVGDFIADLATSPEDNAADLEAEHERKKLIRRLLTKLNLRERRIIRARFLDKKKKTLTELANELGVSRERIRQLEARVLEEFRGLVSNALRDLAA